MAGDVPCRCGWDETGDHPCHRCRGAPGRRRLVTTGPAALAGTQTKWGAYETWGCDPCWEAFTGRPTLTTEENKERPMDDRHEAFRNTLLCELERRQSLDPTGAIPPTERRIMKGLRDGRRGSLSLKELRMIVDDAPRLMSLLSDPSEKWVRSVPVVCPIDPVSFDGIPAVTPPPSDTDPGAVTGGGASDAVYHVTPPEAYGAVEFIGGSMNGRPGLFVDACATPGLDGMRLLWYRWLCSYDPGPREEARSRREDILFARALCDRELSSEADPTAAIRMIASFRQRVMEGFFP